MDYSGLDDFGRRFGGILSREVYSRFGGDAGNVSQSDTDVRACARLPEYPRIFSEKAKSAHTRFYRGHRISLHFHSFRFRGDLPFLRPLYPVRQNPAHDGRRDYRLYRVLRRPVLYQSQKQKGKVVPVFYRAVQLLFRAVDRIHLGAHRIRCGQHRL